MLKTRVMPCMLFNGYQLVKTVKFSAARSLGNPVQAARVYNARNVDGLIFIDLAATEEGREPAYEVIADVMRECFMPVTIGGGIHELAHVERLLKIGADKVSIQSAALNNPHFIQQVAQRYGSQCVVASIDAKREGDEYFVYAKRGTASNGMTAVAWAQQLESLGAGELFLNSVDQDGTMEGFDIPLIKKITSAVTIPVIACGGAGKVQDIIDAISLGGAQAVSLASMFHFSGHTANSIKQRMASAGIPVRLQTDHYFV